jgi:hypothetical protein
LEEFVKLLVPAHKMTEVIGKLIAITGAWAVRFFGDDGPGGVVASYILFVAFSVVEIAAWACIALEAQWAEAFLNGLALSSISKALLSSGHHLFVVSSMIHLQIKFSDGPIGITLREVGRFLSARLRRLSKD